MVKYVTELSGAVAPLSNKQMCSTRQKKTDVPLVYFANVVCLWKYTNTDPIDRFFFCLLFAVKNTLRRAAKQAPSLVQYIYYIVYI